MAITGIASRFGIACQSRWRGSGAREDQQAGHYAYQADVCYHVEELEEASQGCETAL